MLKPRILITVALTSIALTCGLNVEYQRTKGQHSLSIPAAVAQSQEKIEAARLFMQGFQTDNLKARLKSLQTALSLYRSRQDMFAEQIVLGIMGQTHYRLGNLSQAQSYLEQTVQLGQPRRGQPRKRIPGQQPLSFPQDFSQSLGHVYLQQGETEKAREAFKRSDDTRTQKYPDLFLKDAKALKRISLAHMDKVSADNLRLIGSTIRHSVDPEIKLSSYDLALNIYRKLKNHSGETQILIELAWFYQQLGEVEKAEAYFRQTIEAGTQNLKTINISNSSSESQNEIISSGESALPGSDYKRRVQLTTAYANLNYAYAGVGEAALNKGEFKEALIAFEEQLKIARTGEKIFNSPTSSNAWSSSALMSIGLTHLKVGDTKKSIQYIQQARDLKPLYSDHINAALSFVYFKVGELEKAKDILLPKKTQTAPPNQSLLQQQRSSKNKPKRREQTEKKFLLTTEQGQQQRSVWDGFLLSQSESPFIDTCALLQKIHISQGKPLVALEASEGCRAWALAYLLTSNAAGNASSSSSSKSIKLPEIRKIAQQRQATIVQYSIVFEDTQFLSESPGPELLIWVIPPKGKITFRQVDLTKEDKPFEEIVAQTRQSIGARGRAAIVAKQRLDPVTPANNNALKKLHQLLIQPIAEVLPKDPNAHVIFIPEESLFSVPFAALTDSSGQFLVEQHTISTAPSIHSLRLLRQRHKQIKTQKNKQVLVVGNPTMPQYAPPGQPKQTLPPLPGAETEARQIASLYKTKAIIGSKATESAIVPQLGRARIVHFATHGLLDTPKKRYGSQVAALLDPEGGQTFKTPGAIALAPGNGQDGLLTSDEIYKLKLNAELVVLSACDTGQGAVLGDGVVGLSRSLLAAGAPSILASLWKVADEATADLMVAFYQELQSNPDKARALRQAMLKTRQKHPDPVDWAAFTVIGEAG